MKRINYIFLFSQILLVFSFLIIGSCSKDFLEPNVSTDKDLATNINTVEDLNGLVLGMYDRMNEPNYYGRNYIVYAEARSDNAFSNGNSGRFVGVGQFFLNATDGDPTSTWTTIYQVIANANVVINSNIADDATPEAKHLKGEAYAIRAMAHMDLLRLYGQQWSGGSLGIPYVTAYLENLTPSRNSVTEVWTKVGEDLNMASSLMAESLNQGPTRMTTYGVAALKTRYFLYTQEWNKLISAAEYVINSGLFSLVDGAGLASSFVGSGGNSSVFELAYTAADNPNINGLFYIYHKGNYGDIEITEDLYNVFEDIDARKALYSGDLVAGVFRVEGKYPSTTYDDNIRVIRFAEVILNYAEALFKNGQDAVALIELNKTAGKAGATPYASVTLDNILLERRKELAMEGFRFFDLMRNGFDILKVDPGQTFSGALIPFGDPLIAFPIPEAEMNANSNMVQNPGY